METLVTFPRTVVNEIVVEALVQIPSGKKRHVSKYSLIDLEARTSDNSLISMINTRFLKKKYDPKNLSLRLPNEQLIKWNEDEFLSNLETYVKKKYPRTSAIEKLNLWRYLHHPLHMKLEIFEEDSKTSPSKLAIPPKIANSKETVLTTTSMTEPIRKNMSCSVALFGCSDPGFAFYNPHSGSLVQHKTLPSGPYACCALIPSERIFCTSHHQNIIIWKQPTRTSTLPIQCCSIPCLSPSSLSGNRELVVGCGPDKNVRVWRLPSSFPHYIPSFYPKTNCDVVLEHRNLPESSCFLTSNEYLATFSSIMPPMANSAQGTTLSSIYMWNLEKLVAVTNFKFRNLFVEASTHHPRYMKFWKERALMMSSGRNCCLFDIRESGNSSSLMIYQSAGENEKFKFGSSLVEMISGFDFYGDWKVVCGTSLGDVGCKDIRKLSSDWTWKVQVGIKSAREQENQYSYPHDHEYVTDVKKLDCDRVLALVNENIVCVVNMKDGKGKVVRGVINSRREEKREGEEEEKKSDCYEKCEVTPKMMCVLGEKEGDLTKEEVIECDQQRRVGFVCAVVKGEEKEAFWMLLIKNLSMKKTNLYVCKWCLI